MSNLSKKAKWYRYHFALLDNRRSPGVLCGAGQAVIAWKHHWIRTTRLSKSHSVNADEKWVSITRYTVRFLCVMIDVYSAWLAVTSRRPLRYSYRVFTISSNRQLLLVASFADWRNHTAEFYFLPTIVGALYMLRKDRQRDKAEWLLMKLLCPLCVGELSKKSSRVLQLALHQVRIKPKSLPTRKARQTLLWIQEYVTIPAFSKCPQLLPE